MSDKYKEIKDYLSRVGNEDVQNKYLAKLFGVRPQYIQDIKKQIKQDKKNYSPLFDNEEFKESKE